MWLYNCIHVTAKVQYAQQPVEIISYCMNEWSPKWNIQENNLDQKLTFAELFNLNVTSEHLYLWSAPMDLIEEYQLYLNRLSTSNNCSSMETHVFRNCTSASFGSFCQYSFDGYESSDWLLNNIIYDFYSRAYNPTTMTCYQHLQCSRGPSSSCLDWTEICDEHIDCLNDGADEEHCWQLTINECHADEYRCRNGQCIPNTFLYDEAYRAFDCLDKTDEKAPRLLVEKEIKGEPTFMREDVACDRIDPGQFPFTTSCVPKRNSLLIESMFTNESNTLSTVCWHALRCTFQFPSLFQLNCREVCPDRRSCQEMINRTCPHIFFVPDVPILFGHIYFAYTKEAAIAQQGSRLAPTYICYDIQRCDGYLSHVALLPFNNKVCVRPQDVPLFFFPDPISSWSHRNLRLVYDRFVKCNVIIQNNIAICNNSLMYQCVNSSKCILHHHVGDGVANCIYGEDETQSVIDDVCLKDRLNLFFKCSSMNKCIPHSHVGNSECDCGTGEDGLCDDESVTSHYIRKHIAFANICDGFTDLIPVLIDGQHQTDETECELWQCNNTYTRCNQIWNCFNGADEVNCGLPSFVNCSQEHQCIAVRTNQPMCLPVEQANDGIIDCVGAIDEPELCRANTYASNNVYFYCHNRLAQPCLLREALCFTDEQYPDDHKTEFCYQIDNVKIYFKKRQLRCAFQNTITAEYFHQYLKSVDRRPPLYFALDRAESATLQNTNPFFQPLSVAVYSGPIRQRCHRGLPLRVWINKEKNLTDTTCLCPPSFYGDICQYQNQRVSLTMKLQVYSDSYRTLFAIVVSLIDNSTDQIIHSYQQFTFLFIRDCGVKFNTYLLYSTRPKSNLRNYSVRLDFYEKMSLAYRGSSLLPIQFPFLPVYRIATILTAPSLFENIAECTDQQCRHGRCMKYWHDAKGSTFCHCHAGWSGRYCHIPYTCTCANDSLCIGISANNRTICVCPLNKFGSRCLLSSTVCQSNSNDTCYNGGHCIPVDDHLTSKKKYFCICGKGFTGDRCEIPDAKILLSFHEDIVLPQWITVYFIQTIPDKAPENGSTFITIPTYQRTAMVYWKYPFHIAFIKLFHYAYYLIAVQNRYNTSTRITRAIQPSDRCQHLSEILNKTIVEYHLLRRIKYYHFVCQRYSPSLTCFYDDDYFCLCDHFGHRRVANCFEFDGKHKLDCFGYSKCENDGECMQDRPTCPRTSMCLCRSCFYGKLCQFTSNGFGLSLDGILGYHIQPNSSVTHQSSIVQVSVVLTLIIIVAGLVNSVLMMMTFKNEGSRTVGCGQYLLCSSVTTLFTTVIFAFKFWILMIAQITYVTNRFFLRSQCFSIDFLLRTGLQFDQWLHACIAIERTMIAIKGGTFNKLNSKRMAKYIMPFLLASIIITTLPDPFHRRLINEEDDDDSRRIWCIVVYSSFFKSLTSYVNTFHSFAPFSINIIASIVIIVTTARRKTAVHMHRSYRHVLFEQIREYKHLFISSMVLIILTLPRLLISFVSGCMKSMDDSELFLAGYFISFIPSAVTFAVFVLPSKTYKEEFYQSIRRCQTRVRAYLCRTT